MNNTINEIKSRKSIRVYENRGIEDDKKAAIIDAALQAPTAGNMTLYTIIDVTDGELKKRLSVTCDDQPFIATAPMVLVFCADYRRWFNVFEKNCKSVRAPGEGDLLLSVSDALIAAQNSVVAAESMGIGSCYIGDIIENYEIHKELFSLPEYVAPVCMVCFGYPTENQKNRKKPPRFKAEDIVFENTYNEEKSNNMEQMIKERNGLSDDEFPGWIEKFCTRKWNSDFSVEMTRSAQEIIRDWCRSKI